MSNEMPEGPPPPLKFKQEIGRGEATGENPALRLDRESSRCQHTDNVTLIVDAEDRTVTCSKCSAVLDHFDALLLLSRAERRSESRMEEMRALYDVKRSAERIDRDYRSRHCKHRYAEVLKCGTGRYCPSCSTVLPLDGAPHKLNPSGPDL